MNWKKGLQAALLVIIPCLLILREPDVGTVLVFIPLTVFMLIWAGMKMRFLLIAALPLLALFSGFHWIGLAVFMVLLTAGLGLARIRWQYSFVLLALCLGIGLMAPMAWNRLEPYQQQRMLIYLGMKSDPHGAAYQVIQSKVAIGSGGILGKGFLHGSQTQLRFLPEQHTDFVFSVLGEEFGFLGVSVVLGLFIGLILRMITIARNTPDRFASFVAAGSASVIGFQTLVNIGMTLGLLPVTGVPLPFLSYGGSSLIAMCGLVGMTASGAGRLYDYS